MEVVPEEHIQHTEDMQAVQGDGAASADNLSMQAIDQDDDDSVAEHQQQLDGDQTPAFQATPDQIGTPVEEHLEAGNRAAAEAKRQSIIALTGQDGLQPHPPKVPGTAERMSRLAAGGTPDAPAGEVDPEDADIGAVPSGPRSLEKSIIQASLSGLGHTESGGMVYTTVTLSSLSLVDIDALAPFVNLQKVLVDNNHLTSLAPLADNCSLVHVSASHNQLDNDVFSTLHNSRRSIQTLDISFNQLTSIGGVGEFTFLRELNVSNNSLTTLEDEGQVRGLRSLTTLQLGNNEIENISENAFDGCNIRHLDISQNGVTDLSALGKLSHCLMTLDASDNNVMHFGLITQFTKLATFNLAGNNAYDLQEVHSLAQLPLLRNVSLLGNPLCSLNHGIEAPLDDDTASDIVRNDAPSGNRGRRTSDASKNITAAATAGTTTNNGAIFSATNAASTAANFNTTSTAVKAATTMQLSPEEEDQVEYSQQDTGDQYRLCVLWRAPNVTILDGVQVTPEELTKARNLQGGTDRNDRATAQKQFLHSSGAPALSLRKSKRNGGTI